MGDNSEKAETHANREEEEIFVCWSVAPRRNQRLLFASVTIADVFPLDLLKSESSMQQTHAQMRRSSGVCILSSRRQRKCN